MTKPGARGDTRLRAVMVRALRRLHALRLLRPTDAPTPVTVQAQETLWYDPYGEGRSGVQDVLTEHRGPSVYSPSFNLSSMMPGLSGSGVRTRYEGMSKAAYSCRFV